VSLSRRASSANSWLICLSKFSSNVETYNTRPRLRATNIFKILSRFSILLEVLRESIRLDAESVVRWEANNFTITEIRLTISLRLASGFQLVSAGTPEPIFSDGPNRTKTASLQPLSPATGQFICPAILVNRDEGFEWGLDGFFSVDPRFETSRLGETRQMP
jgi:hypothetical protein